MCDLRGWWYQLDFPDKSAARFNGLCDQLIDNGDGTTSCRVIQDMFAEQPTREWYEPTRQWITKTFVGQGCDRPSLRQEPKMKFEAKDFELLLGSKGADDVTMEQLVEAVVALGAMVNGLQERELERDIEIGLLKGRCDALEAKEQ